MFLLIDGVRELETDSQKTILEAVKAHVREGRHCLIEIGFASANVKVPPVGDGRSDQLLYLEDSGELPKRVRKERSDKGKVRRKK